jgi:hypothetical protein
MKYQSEVKDALLQADLGLTENDFDVHGQTLLDLYVVNKPGVLEFMAQHFPNKKPIGHFIGASGTDWEGKQCLDIPFGAYQVQ